MISGEDELRVQRSEEELSAGTRQGEACSVGVRKRVRTEREQLRVPKRREEVHVERVPVEEGRQASETEIGEVEVFMPVVEEEEIIEENVRKEEVDIDYQTERHSR